MDWKRLRGEKQSETTRGGENKPTSKISGTLGFLNFPPISENDPLDIPQVSQWGHFQTHGKNDPLDIPQASQ